MFEKVNPAHPDKVADRIAGALVDLAYRKAEDPRIAVEVLIGHGECHIIVETSVHLEYGEVQAVVDRIAGAIPAYYREVPQDEHLARNQEHGLRCGDNGIFRGTPVTEEQKRLTNIAQELYQQYESDGKYILSGKRLILCQSNADSDRIRNMYPGAEVNPLGEWTGGTGVDSGAANRNGSWAVTWGIRSRAEGCTARICPKQTSVLIFTHGCRLRRKGRRWNIRARSGTA